MLNRGGEGRGLLMIARDSKSRGKREEKHKRIPSIPLGRCHHSGLSIPTHPSLPPSIHSREPPMISLWVKIATSSLYPRSKATYMAWRVRSSSPIWEAWSRRSVLDISVWPMDLRAQFSGIFKTHLSVCWPPNLSDKTIRFATNEIDCFPR